MLARNRLVVTLFLGTLLAAGAAAWLGRTSFLCWYYTRQLAGAGADDRASWADHAAGMDEAIVPSLVECLKRDEAPACANVRAALERLVERWGTGDPRQATLVNQLVEAFPHLSPAGQGAVLELEARWLQTRPGQPGWKACAARLLALGGRSADKDVRHRALALGTAWLQQPVHAEGVAACRELVRLCLKDGDAGNRAAAVSLARHPEVGLVRDVAPLLDDPAPEVRKAALLAVGSAEEVPTDDLLRSLHDSDADVRRLCESALRGRGLVRDQDLLLARLVSDTQPAVRLQVLDRLSRAADLEPGVWLRRLSQDPAPAVRAAAARAAAEQDDIDFTEALEKMAREDPSATVRQLARHYLECHNSLQKQKFRR